MNKKFRLLKLKEAIKAKKKWLIGSGIFLLLGIIAWIIACYLSGHSIIEWLTTPFAITIYTCLTVVILIAIFIVSWEYRKHLGEK